MSIWPFQIGHFIELPYTLVQDCTLTRVIGTGSPDIWLNKFDFLYNHYGLVLVNVHPDHWCSPTCQQLYMNFLKRNQTTIGILACITERGISLVASENEQSAIVDQL